MCERHEINLHRIDLEIIETSLGRFRWLYLIDCDRLETGATLLDSADEARDEALASARSTIEEQMRTLLAYEVIARGRAQSAATSERIGG